MHRSERVPGALADPGICSQDVRVGMVEILVNATRSRKMEPRFIDFQTVDANLDWLALAQALEGGHWLPRAKVGSTYLERSGDTVMSLSAWIDGFGIAVKTPTIFPKNARFGISAVNGAFCLYCDRTGVLLAIIDFHAITKWKTAADSLLAALKLAPNAPKNITIAGAGTVARSMVEAYGAGFPDATMTVWNRTAERAEQLRKDYPWVKRVDELQSAVESADIVCCTTMSVDPILRGAWLRPGQHIDLIGSYLPNMREADDEAVQRARIFVDNREMTSRNSGDLVIPLSTGAIAPGNIIADFYDLPRGRFSRQSDQDITLFKNGGGAHLDLMTARHILDVCGGVAAADED